MQATTAQTVKQNIFPGKKLLGVLAWKEPWMHKHNIYFHLEPSVQVETDRKRHWGSSDYSFFLTRSVNAKSPPQLPRIWAPGSTGHQLAAVTSCSLISAWWLAGAKQNRTAFANLIQLQVEKKGGDRQSYEPVSHPVSDNQE